MSQIIKAENISKHFTIGSQRIQILKNISLTIGKGEFVVVAGSSGSGKSTLLSVLSGLDKPDGGRVELCLRDITPMSEDQLAPVRNTLIGFVFQSFHLIPSLTALENIQFPAELKKDPDATNKAQALLEKVGLSQRANNYPSQMSGGEQQRVAICRALINAPQIVFADEPTGNLDSGNSTAIIELLAKLHEELGMTLVIVTHSRSLAARADRVIVLRDGVIEAGSQL
ncbi:ABC transporter ATP-binding protein [Desulforhopalus sp. IMCC35007]|uniref:ABC transporter ATP-binding protein n=1 Tax=Desulforhopalus sp. IMCC35007 TaxID=2569543 RepID=UPI0010AEADDA|nr:ABC transporter ATP-binding protein [Desulforhopalus sp. IMCC35007]TKB08160.1 ABC transporter ATP-binding protein [Desulforhopalus sp. IMCC35007]